MSTDSSSQNKGMMFYDRFFANAKNCDLFSKKSEAEKREAIKIHFKVGQSWPLPKQVFFGFKADLPWSALGLSFDQALEKYLSKESLFFLRRTRRERDGIAKTRR